MKKLIEVKKAIGKVKKNAKNPFFKSSYMDLDTLLENVEPLLLDNDLLLIQPIEDNYVVSRIIDVETGLSIESKLQLLDIKDAQKLGACITYFRRYTLKSLLAIAETDDDGNSLQSKPKPQGKPTLAAADFSRLLNQSLTVIKAQKDSFAFTPEQTTLLNAKIKELEAKK